MKRKGFGFPLALWLTPQLSQKPSALVGWESDCDEVAVEAPADEAESRIASDIFTLDDIACSFKLETDLLPAKLSAAGSGVCMRDRDPC